MSKDWFIGDTHFYHGNIMKYCNREGLSTKEKDLLSEGVKFEVSRESIFRMNDLLIDEINSVVEPNDRLWHLGDVLFGNRKYVYENCRKSLDRINCRNIHLIRGNHDSPVIEPLFKSVHDMYVVRVGNQEIQLCHYALAIWDKCHRGRWHLYGHSHSTAEAELDAMMPGRCSMDIGVDNLLKVFGRYAPVDFDQIASILGNRPGHSLDHHLRKS